jgi:hypothetical protein
VVDQVLEMDLKVGEGTAFGVHRNGEKNKQKGFKPLDNLTFLL